jgi:ribosome maturation factor RimP
METIENSLKEMIEAEGLQFYDTQVAKDGEQTIYRVLIKRKDGHVSIDDCVKITNIISPFLDVEEPLSGNYNLEVSSPGIDRKLEKLKHYELSVGEDVEVTLGDKSKVVGKLTKVEGEEIHIADVSVDDIAINFQDIKKGKTLFKF